MGRRTGALLAALALALAACGVERSSDDVVAAPDSATEDVGAGAAGDGTGDDATGDEEPAPTLPTTTTTAEAPPTTGAPGDVALSADFADESWEITHGELNDVVVPTQENDEFVTLVFGGQRPPGFDVGVLTEHLVNQAVLFELEELGVDVTDENVEAARTRLLNQVEGLYADRPDPATEAQRLYDEVPYLPFLVQYQAAQDALTGALSEAAEPGEGEPCVRHILLESEPEADAAVVRLESGEDFGELAAELSTGPTGPTGGNLGCAPASNYVPEFAAAVESATLGEVTGPIETQFGWHVLVVDRYEIDGRAIAGERLRERLDGATVDVDEALGRWDDDSLVVVPPGS